MNKLLFAGLSALLFVSPKAAASASWADDEDPCVQAAILQTESEFPLHQKITTQFFEWASASESSWETFKNIENLGFANGSLAHYASNSEITHIINVDYADDANQRLTLLSEIANRPVLSLIFNFNKGTLDRYFVVVGVSGHTCEVQHIDAKIDDFDNG